DWKTLNGRWQFCIQKRDAKDPTAFEGNILVPFSLQSPLSGALDSLSNKRKQQLGLSGPPCAPGLSKRYELWYQRGLELPQAWRAQVAQGKCVVLHIGACDYTCQVFVNGTAVGKPHVGGSTAFEYDITGALSSNPVDVLLIKCSDHEEKGANAMELRGKQLVSKAYRGPGPHVPTLYSNVTGFWQSVWIELVGPRRLRRVHCVPRCLGRVSEAAACPSKKSPRA
ncbi:GUSB, partial [Symbiodinium pilosum]